MSRQSDTPDGKETEYQRFAYKITYTGGLHAIPAAVLVKKCNQFTSQVRISKGDKSADARRVVGVMALGVKCGETVTVTVESTDEGKTAEALQNFMAENL